jgi:hypothetical protein
MAPETFSGKSYGPKIDVYSFGMLLYELLTNSIPWQGMDATAVVKAVALDGLRPELPKSTPAPLGWLIEQCWQESSDARPDFDAIYKLFRDGDVEFEGTDKGAIKQLDDLIRRSVEGSQNWTGVFCYWSNPQFMNKFRKSARNLEKVDQFYISFSKLMNEDLPDHLLKFVLQELTAMLRNPPAAAAFIRLQVYKHLPFSHHLVGDACFGTLMILVQNSAASLDRSFAAFLSEITLLAPNKIMVVLASYSTTFSDVSDPYPIIDIMIEKWRPFMECGSGAELVSTLFYLCSSFVDYRENRIRRCCEIFCEGLRTGDVKTLRQIYNALCFYYLSGVKLDYGAIARHLFDKRISENVLRFLVKLKKVEATPELIAALISVAHEDLRATLLLIHIARKFGCAEKICANHTWLANEVPTIEATLRLFLMVFGHVELRKGMCNWPEIPIFFVNLCSKRDSELLAVIAMIVRRIGVTKRFLDNLSHFGALKTIFETVKLCGDDLAMKAALAIIESLGKIGFVAEFLMLSNEMKHQLTLENSTSSLTVVVMSILSRYQECRTKFVSMKLIPYFEQLMNIDTYRDRAEVFLKSVRGC